MDAQKAEALDTARREREAEEDRAREVVAKNQRVAAVDEYERQRTASRDAKLKRFEEEVQVLGKCHKAIAALPAQSELAYAVERALERAQYSLNQLRKKV